MRKHWMFIIADLVGYQVSFVCAYWARNGLKNPYGDEVSLRLALILAFIVLMVGFGTRTYAGIMSRGHLLEFRSVITCDLISVGILIALLFVMKSSAEFSRVVVILILIIAPIVVTLCRIAAKKIIINRPMAQENARHIVLVCSEDELQQYIERLKKSRTKDYLKFSGAAIVEAKSDEGNKELDIPLVAYGIELLDYINGHVVDGVFVTVKAQEYFSRHMLYTCIDMGVTVHQELSEAIGNENQIVERIGDTYVISSSMKITTSRQIVMKRLMDIAGGIVGSMITLVILLIVTPIIKAQSPGPIIFKQKRVGKGGRIFTIYKIRTMYIDAEERKAELMAANKMQGLMFKVDNDPRIYPFGHFLRETSLDEFPQFFNVLKGEMSLVGTRPPTLDEYEQYEFNHQKRLSIKPGITGLWQTSGRSEVTDFEEIVKLDAEYITNWRILSDIKILWNTLGVVFSRGGAQ